MKNLVYLAGPIGGLTWDEASKWRDHASKLINSFTVECLSPLRDMDGVSLRDSCFVTDGGKIGNEPQDPSKDAIPFEKLFDRDYQDVVDSNFILFNFLGAKKQSVGTVCELAWAWHMRKPYVVVIEPDNINHNPFLKKQMRETVPTLQEGINAVRRYFSVPEYL